MKKLFYFLIISGLATLAPAQSDLLYTHFMFNKLAYNPAYAGTKGAFDALALYRNQWSGLEGAPQTATVNLHAPFANKTNGIGLSITGDQIGKVNTAALDLNYAYYLRLNGDNVLSLGLQGRLEQTNIKWSEADPLEQNDQLIPNSDESQFTPNFGVGAYLTNGKYFAGVSIPRLLKSAYYLDRSDGGVSQTDAATWYVMGGVLFDFNSQLQLAPSFMVSYNPTAPVDVDINANLHLAQSFWVGLSYRLDDSFDWLIGYELKNGVRIGASYDFTLSELDKLTTGSYEVMLGYTFKCKDCEVQHLRFF